MHILSVCIHAHVRVYTWVSMQEVSGDWFKALRMEVPAITIHAGLHLTTLIPLSQEPHLTQCLGGREEEGEYV